MRNIVSLLLTFALVITVINLNENKVYAGSDAYFSYRVDVVDSKADSKSRIAIDVAANEDGKVYAYALSAGSEEPTVDEIKKKGTVTEVVANEEVSATAYCYYSYTSVKIGSSYDIYICFEDGDGKVYDPYVEKGWVAKYYDAGDGTKENPYQIWNYRHLYNTKQISGTKYVKLMQDINLADCPYSGYALEDGTFEGEFDGNHKSIINMYGKLINKLEENSVVKDTYLVGANTVTEGKKSVSDCCSTFVDKNYGIIKDCAVINSDYSTHNDTYNAGVICVTNFASGEITRCKVVDCSISCASGYVGGIVGRNEGTVSDCYVKGEIINTSKVGGVFSGIVGINIKDTAKVDKCYADISFESDNIKSGIVGSLSNGIVSNCVSNYIPDDVWSVVRLTSANCGSIVGTIGSGITDSNVSNNQGALTSKPTSDGTPESNKELENLEKVWDIYNGALSETGSNMMVDPLLETVIATKVNNLTGIQNEKFSLEAYPSYETLEYNMQFPAKTVNISKESSVTPTADPAVTPTASPAGDPVVTPMVNPGENPVATPTVNPAGDPVVTPTVNPGGNPVATPTVNPGGNPAATPTVNPGGNPVATPTASPSIVPSEAPTASPSGANKPAKVIIISAKKSKKKTITVKIKKTKNAKKYRVQYATDKKFKKVKNVITKKLTITLKKLKKKLYYIRVRGVNGKAVGPWSRVKKVKL